jgi:hypothetical protein
MNRLVRASGRPGLFGAAGILLVVLAGCFLLTSATPAPAEDAQPEYQAIKIPIPNEIAERMKKHSWRKGCPIPLEKLVYIKLSHWGYDGKVHEGELIVQEEVGDDIVAIFEVLFNNHFPIEKMKLIDEYEGSDDASMEDNNTSAFNCRWVTGKKGVFSKHSYGRAIDINPVANPYVTKKKVLPPAGKAYVDRTKNQKGMIMDGGVVHQAFAAKGWTWGGSWRSIKDFQHFEKKTKKPGK